MTRRRYQLRCRLRRGSEAERNLPRCLRADAWQEYYPATANAVVPRHAGAVRARILRACRALIFVEDSLGRVLEELFLPDVEDFGHRGRQRLKLLARLSGHDR